MSEMGTDRSAAASSSSSATTIALFGENIPSTLTYYLADKGQTVPNVSRRMNLAPGTGGIVLMTESTPFNRDVDMPDEATWVTKIASTADHVMVSMSDFKDKDAVCQGYMSVVVTCSRTAWIGDASTNYVPKPVTQTSTHRFVTTAHNILGTAKAMEYVLHAKPKSKSKDVAGSQLHVEQICMYRLAALLAALKEAGCTVVGYRGEVRFKGDMPKVCPGCEGTAKALGMIDHLKFMKS